MRPLRGTAAVAPAHGTANSCVGVVPTTEVRYMINVVDKIWAAERDGSISIRNGQTGEVEYVIDTATNTGEPNFCWCLLLCEGSVWAGFSGGQIRIYSVEGYFFVKELHQHAGGVYCLAHSNGYVYSGSNDFECFRWHSRKLDFVHQYSGHKNSVRCVLAFSATLITGSDDYTIRVWNILTGEVSLELVGHRGGVLALLRSGEQLWSSSEDGTIRIWSLVTGELIHTITDHVGRVTSLSKIDDRVYSSGVDRTLCCFNLETFKRLGRYQDHEGYINNLVLVGHYVKYFLWSSSSDKTIRIWDHDTIFRYASSPKTGTNNGESDDAAPLNEALEERCIALQGRLQAALGQHETELQQCSTNMISLGDTMQRMQQQLDEKDAALQVTQRQAREYQSEVLHRQEEADKLRGLLEKRETEAKAREQEHAAAMEQCQQLLSDRDAELKVFHQQCIDAEKHIETLNLDRLAVEEQYQAKVQAQEQALQEKELHNAELEEEILRRTSEFQEMRALHEQKDSTFQELQQRLKSYSSRIESNCRSMTDLNLENEKLKAELNKRETELKQAAVFAKDLEKAAGVARSQAQDLEDAMANEKQKNVILQQCIMQAEQSVIKWKDRVEGTEKESADSNVKVGELKEALLCEQRKKSQLQDCLLQAETKARKLQDRVSELEEQLREREASLDDERSCTLGFQEKLRELEADRQEHVKKETEFEFVIQSRSELVRQIWELFCEISHVKKTYRELVAQPQFKPIHAYVEEGRMDVATVLENINTAKDRNKRIVANYFSEIEKLHVGTSPYFFPPDENSVKYRIGDGNLEALKKMAGASDIRRNSLLTSARDKGLNSSRACSAPPTKRELGNPAGAGALEAEQSGHQAPVLMSTPAKSTGSLGLRSRQNLADRGRVGSMRERAGYRGVSASRSDRLVAKDLSGAG